MGLIARLCNNYEFSFIYSFSRKNPISNDAGVQFKRHMQNEFKHPGEVLRLLPYLIQEDRKKFIDDFQLYNNDQRSEWWKKYAFLKNKQCEHNGLPVYYANKEMDEITAQPFLNYLIALALEYKDNTDNPVIFENFNSIYSHLLDGVYNREYSPHRIIDSLDRDYFVLILKKIALCTWHGNGRTTTTTKINDYIDNNELQRFISSPSHKNVISLLTIFYFRQTGRVIEGTETFEFTHKSFREYLVALEIIDALTNIHAQLRLKETDRLHDLGWNIDECLVAWLKIFGLQIPDADLVKYIKNELILRESKSKGLLIEWQDTVIKLLGHVLEKGMPIERLYPRPTFKEENELKAEKAILIMHSLIAEITDKVSDIRTVEGISDIQISKKTTSFGEFIGRLVGQRINHDVFILKFCNHIKINNAILRITDLYGANLIKSDLRAADLRDANLSEASLNNANLSEANLNNAKLNKAYLNNANLHSADLSDSDLRDSDLREADLRRSYLRRAIFERAFLCKADLSSAYMRKVKSRKANLTYANLSKANLHEADLREANLTYAKLIDADLSDAYLSGADLSGAVLRNCIGFNEEDAIKCSCIIDKKTRWS